MLTFLLFTNLASLGGLGYTLWRWRKLHNRALQLLKMINDGNESSARFRAFIWRRIGLLELDRRTEEAMKRRDPYREPKPELLWPPRSCVCG